MPDSNDEVTFETEARSMGWAPKEEFRGDETRWVDAKTFVERGHTVLPIIKKKNQELESMVGGLQGEVKRLTELFKSSQEAIGDLKEFHTRVTREKVEQARKAIITELKQAKKDGDTDLEVDLMEELTKTDKALEAKPKEEEKKQAPAPQGDIDPQVVDWASRNAWYGMDMRKTNLANSIANGLRADPENDHLTGAKFFERVDAEIALRLKGETSDKVGGARHSGGGGGAPVKKGYKDLDAEAKGICDKDAKKFVGEGKMFKTNEDWRQYYADSVLGE